MPLGNEGKIIRILHPGRVFAPSVDRGRTGFVDRVKVSQPKRIAVERRGDKARLRWPAPKRLPHASRFQQAKAQPRQFLQRQGHADTGCTRADNHGVQPGAP